MKFKEIHDTIVNDLELSESNRISPVLVVLSCLFISGFVVSNIIASKSVLLYNWTIGGDRLSIASSFLVFPITYIISDIFSEVYGYAWSRIISWIAFFSNLIMVGLISIAIVLPGTDANFDEVFKAVLGSSFGIVMASQLAFMLGDFVNDRIFRRLKRKDQKKTNLTFLFRSISSSLAGELIDSLIFLPLLYLAIGGFGTIITSFLQFVAIVCFQAIFKTVIEIIGAPIEVAIVNFVKRNEKKEIQNSK